MPDKLLYKIFVLFISLFILLPASLKAEEVTLVADINEDFKQANDYYEQGQYFKSIDLYKKIINTGVNNGYIYFNLANAYFKNEQLGQAILNYKIAELLQPRNSDVKANLKFALEQTEDQLSTEESVRPVLGIIFFWFYDFNITEIIIITIISNFILCLLAALFIYKRNDILRTIMFIVLLITLILITSTILKVYALNHPSEAVITEKKATIKSGNGDTYSTLFTLNEGTILDVSDKKGDWYKFSLSDGRKGWINIKEIGLVKPERL